MSMTLNNSRTIRDIDSFQPSIICKKDLSKGICTHTCTITFSDKNKLKKNLRSDEIYPIIAGLNKEKTLRHVQSGNTLLPHFEEMDKLQKKCQKSDPLLDPNQIIARLFDEIDDQIKEESISRENIDPQKISKEHRPHKFCCIIL